MLQEDLENTIEYLKSELAKLRAGRSSIDLVENIEVEVYNTRMPLNQLATLSSPEPRLILIQPWDKNIIKDIENALRRTLSDVNPVVDSDLIRLPFPSPTEERRRELVKEVGKMVEEARIRIRHIREDNLSELKNSEDKKEISEDELFQKKDEVQESIDEYNKKVDEMGKSKEEEVMTI